MADSKENYWLDIGSERVKVRLRHQSFGFKKYHYIFNKLYAVFIISVSFKIGGYPFNP